MSQHIAANLAFLSDLRDLTKERAQIERDYAYKLEMLAKKFHAVKEKKMVSLLLGTASAVAEPDGEMKRR